MSAGFTDRRDAFSREFFGLDGPPSPTDALGQVTRLWWDDLLDEEHIAILPRPGQQGTTWYGLAFDERHSRELREQLLAFVGPSYSDFRGCQTPLRRDDPLETALWGFTGGYALVFHVEEAQMAVEAARLMWDVRRARQIRDPSDARAVGRLLRDFHLALLAGDRDGAEDALASLRSNRAIDAVNLLFLAVQLRAELGLWREIVDLPQFADLLQMRRRPRLVTRALLRAVYQVHLRSDEEAGDAGVAIQRFRDEVYPQMPSLFATRARLTDPEILKLFMLLAVISQPPRPDLAEEILAIPGIPDQDRRYMERLAAQLPPLPASVTTAAGPDFQTAYDDGDLDLAVKLVLAAPPTLGRARVLLDCAGDLEDRSLAAIALEAVEMLPEGDRQMVLKHPRRARSWQQLKEWLTQPAEPSDWCEWLDRIQDPGWRRADELATLGAVEWPVTPLIHRPDAIREMQNLLDAAAIDPIGNPRLSTNLPHLMVALKQDDSYPHPEFAGLYLTLRTAFELSDLTYTENELLLYFDLCQASLACGLKAVEYRSLTQSMSGLWAKFAAPRLLPQALDLLDLLLSHPCPDVGARNDFATAVAQSAAHWVRHGRPIPSPLWGDLRRFLAELGLSDLIMDVVHSREAEGPDEVSGRSEPLAHLSGIIGIYTLTPSAAWRVKEYLETLNARCEVRVNDDQVLTPGLKALAKAADIFVMITSSAKHAATIGIQQCRPKNKPLLTPRGKGSVGILEELRRWARMQQTDFRAA